MNVNLRIMGRDITVKETLIDRAVRYFDPIRGVQRLKARTMMALAGGYTGASRSRRQTQQWITRGGDPDTDLLPDLPTLRERSRDLVRNEPLAGGAINTVVTNVVGTGLKLQSNIDSTVLGMTEDEADAWEAQTEREWRLFSESKEIDTTRTSNFTALQDLAFRSTLENGDVFILLPMFQRPGSPYKTKLQMIEADRITNKDNVIDNDIMSGGVERDENGAPVRYHVLKKHPGRLLGGAAREWISVDAFGKTTARPGILHLFRILRPGQSRGVPYLAPVIETLKQLGRYTEAELMATVISSFFTVFIKSGLGNDFAPMTPIAETGAKAGDEDLKLGTGAVVSLADGESIETANPNRPNTAFDSFVLAVLRQIGVALEIPYEILIKNFTASYSASRGALLEAWKFFNSRRQWLADNFCQPVYEAFLWEAVSSGRIHAPGFLSDPLIRKAYLGSNWVGPARGQIDELKEVEAAKERRDLGISTLSEICAEMTGGDWERKHRQSVKEHNRRVADGLESAVPAITGPSQRTFPSDNNP